MTRLMFEARRRVAPPQSRRGAITVEPPPELPRTAASSPWRQALPLIIVLLLVALVVAMVATGMRILSPQTLFFPVMMLLIAAGFLRGNGSSMSPEEVDAERADYLRYLSRIRDTVLTDADEQRRALEWSHPDPATLRAVPGSRRQWERDHGDQDFLVVRAGRGDVALHTALKVGDIPEEVDLEPVCHSALRSLLETHRSMPNAPFGLDLAGLSLITVLGEPEDFRAVATAWAAQAVTWHDPTVLALAIVSREVDSPAWAWAKWLPHTDVPGLLDGAGPARFLAADTEQLRGLLGQTLSARPAFTGRGESGSFKHVLVIVDDPDADLATILANPGLAAVTVLRRGVTQPPHDHAPDPARPILRVTGGTLERWGHASWQVYVDRVDRMSPQEADHLARRLSCWDSGPASAGLRSARTRGASFTTLLGIPDASDLDITSLWAPRHRDEELRVPIGVTATGQPLYFDLKDEAEGGMGPHGLMIGMTGSGKSQTLMSILLSLLTTHSADRLIVIYADFKGEAGADIFRDFPQVVAVISNMSDKKSLADRFADTLRGEVARREQLLKESGRQVQGSAFNSVLEYENAIAAGHDLPPIPTLFVVADEFTLMLAEHPEYAELFDYVARKGRSFRIHILFASQTLDVGKIKDIDKNTSYRVGLKVASAGVSRQIIGVEDAYHIESGREHKGVGFFVAAPGAAPVKFRSTYVDGVYEPPRAPRPVAAAPDPAPRLFTASPVDTPVVELAPAELVLPLATPKKLVAMIGDQLAQHGPRAPKLWLPPLDEPIPLDALLRDTGIAAGELRWPIGEIDRPFHMRRDPLLFDAASAGGNLLVHGGPKSGKSTALITFVLAAAATHSPEDVQFYCVDYGGGRLRALSDLAHVGSVAANVEQERIRRTFGELRQLLHARQQLFRQHEITSIDDFRGRRTTERALQDGCGDVFLVVDNLYAFSRDNIDQFQTKNPLLAQLTEIATSGLAYGLHVVITTPSWIEVPLAMRDGLGLRLELKLQDAQDSNVRVVGAVRRPAEAVPAGQPGRGLTMAAEHFLIAEPRISALAEINAQHPGREAPPVRLLPTDLDPGALGGPLLTGPERIVIGQREEDLALVDVDFAANPLMLVLGDAKSGKTTLLRHIIRALRENSAEDRVAFTLFDRRLRLVDEPLFPDNEYTPNVDRMIPAMLGLTSIIEKRRPSAGLTPEQLRRWSFSGQVHYLIIDDVDQIPDTPAMSGPFAGQRPWAGLIGLLAQAGELGLRVVLTARAAGSGHTLMTHPLLRRFTELQARTLMLSGNPQDSGKVRGHKFVRLPPGRAVLLDDDDAPAHVQLVNARQLAGASSANRKEPTA